MSTIAHFRQHLRDARSQADDVVPRLQEAERRRRALDQALRQAEAEVDQALDLRERRYAEERLRAVRHEHEAAVLEERRLRREHQRLLAAAESAERQLAEAIRRAQAIQQALPRLRAQAAEARHALLEAQGRWERAQQAVRDAEAELQELAGDEPVPPAIAPPLAAYRRGG
ncbi:MAG TPA: hypothetical protein VFB73_04780 [Chloroflexota bacterium]|nr:hypothetical protein [Chloroflexota bacterium]